MSNGADAQSATMSAMTERRPTDRFRELRWTVRTLTRSGLLALLRPDKYARMAGAVRRHGITATTGIALSAARFPDALGLVDERGALTWRELEERSSALAVGLAELATIAPTRVALLCRNHRGFVDGLGAAGRLGADTLLLNTGFAGPQLAEVVEREGVDVLIYDEEFAGIVDGVRATTPSAAFVLGWTDAVDASRDGVPTAESLIADHLGQKPPAPTRTGKIVLLTSGTTGTPKGASRSAGGGAGDLASILDRVPWRAGETTVLAAPMFHAWGFGQLLISATMGCTVVTRRRFDPEATLELVDRHRASGLAVVPVMIERIMDLPADVLARYDLGTLRFATASGSRMRPDSVTAFMDAFGDVVYNNYNATEAGMIATATPSDLRVAPDTAGRPVHGTHVRILGDDGNDVPRGEVGQMFVRNSTQFDGYTSGDNKAFRDGYMASGDLGREDDDGRLYVVGRDDEMIVSGGENVYPLEVEATLAKHPGVREAVVVGVDDESFGQRLAAYVVTEPGADVSEQALRDHVKSQLAGYKVPRDVTFLDELPRNATGKVMKRDLP